MQSVLGIIRGTTRLVDIMEMKCSDGVRYGLACVGWGLPAMVVHHRHRSRNSAPLPTLLTQVSVCMTSIMSLLRVVFRTVIDFVMDLTLWTSFIVPVQAHAQWVQCRAVIAFPRTVDGAVVWEEHNVAMHGLLATKMPRLGPAWSLTSCEQCIRVSSVLYRVLWIVRDACVCNLRSRGSG